MPFIVAMDGPAGAGKSTVARRVAERLGLERVDTGAIYRTVTLVSQRENLSGEAEVVARLSTLELRFEDDRVWLGEEDVSQAIRASEVSASVSRIAAMPGVRTGLLELQRRLARACPAGAILEGRDIGTVVFPGADVKIFLTASVDERARRRMRDLDRTGEKAAFDEVRASIERRDRLDRERETAPLKQADDAVLVETDGKSEDQVVDELVCLIQGRRAERAGGGPSRT